MDLKEQKTRYLKQLKRQEAQMKQSASHKVFGQIDALQAIKKEEDAFLNECLRKK